VSARTVLGNGCGTRVFHAALGENVKWRSPTKKFEPTFWQMFRFSSREPVKAVSTACLQVFKKSIAGSNQHWFARCESVGEPVSSCCSDTILFLSNLQPQLSGDRRREKARRPCPGILKRDLSKALRDSVPRLLWPSFRHAWLLDGSYGPMY